jgi:hypothetical protein
MLTVDVDAYGSIDQRRGITIRASFHIGFVQLLLFFIATRATSADAVRVGKHVLVFLQDKLLSTARACHWEPNDSLHRVNGVVEHGSAISTTASVQMFLSAGLEPVQDTAVVEDVRAVGVGGL